jgi:hypothetical protein
MDLLATLFVCSLYPADDALVRAIAEGPSSSDPYFVRNPAVDEAQDGTPSSPKSEREAAARAASLVAAGARPLLGLLELPPSWLEAFGRPLESAFDPCLNIAIGTAMLSEFDAACGSSGIVRGAWAQRLERTNRRACVLHRYEAALGASDFAEAIWLELSVQRPAAPSLEDAPIFASSSARTWGPDRLLVPLPVAAAPPSVRPPPSP